MFQARHLYTQIRDELGRRIANEVYPSGTTLPSEIDLSVEMGVSIGTIRKAVEMLCAEKLVVRKHGRGTMVADRQSADYRGKFDRIRNADGSPIAWTFRLLSLDIRAADPVEQNKLGLHPEEKIVAIVRLREDNGRPIKDEHSRIPHSVFGDVDPVEASETTIENLALKRHLLIARIDEWISLSSADKVAAERFRIPLRTPILKLERIVRESSGRVIEWRIAHCHMEDRKYLAPSPLGTMPMKARGPASAPRPAEVRPLMYDE